MDISKIKEGRTVNYKSRGHAGRGKVIEKYQRKNGWWLIVHDKARNASVSLRPAQVFH